ncbi:hypothetical protein ACFQ0M_09150 [Kitasatospora aburaviensis]
MPPGRTGARRRPVPPPARPARRHPRRAAARAPRLRPAPGPGSGLGSAPGGCACPPSAADLLRRDPRAAAPAVRLTETVGGAVWLPAQDLLAAGPEGRLFVAETYDERVTAIRFGDGRTGRQPDPGATFTARYRIGAGPAGNVGAETITHLALRRGVGGHDLVVRPRNPLPAVGGTAPETPAAARQAVPQAFRAVRERAVLPEDYAELARRAGGDRLQGAAADLVWTGSWYEADVALDPRVGAAPAGAAAPAGGGGDEECTRARITAALEQARRLGHDLRVTLATGVPVELELTVCVEPFHVRAQVARTLREEFSAGVLPDGRLGWFHPDRWTFGEGVYVSRALAAAQAVSGVAAAEVTVLRRQGEPDRGAIGRGVLPIGPREIAVLDTTRPQGGRFTVVAGGGR